jgi:hypothetical protein
MLVFFPDLPSLRKPFDSWLLSENFSFCQLRFDLLFDLFQLKLFFVDDFSGLTHLLQSLKVQGLRIQCDKSFFCFFLSKSLLLFLSLARSLSLKNRRSRGSGWGSHFRLWGHLLSTKARWHNNWVLGPFNTFLFFLGFLRFPFDCWSLFRGFVRWLFFSKLNLRLINWSNNDWFLLWSFIDNFLFFH